MISQRFAKCAGLCVLAALFATVCSEPIAALARAGGGQHYGGGGGGGFGGGGGGGGLFNLWPLLFLGHGSGFGTFLFILLLIYLYQRSQRRSFGWTPTANRWSPTLDAGVTNDDAQGPITLSAPPHPVDTSGIATGIAAIKARDPNFDEKVFLDRAETAFFKCQQAWAARNQDLARDVMTDTLYERHKMQTDQLIANHQIDVLQNIVIGHSHITEVNAAQPYDTIVVRFDASMTDYTIDEHTKQIVDGDQYAHTFTEYWTFIRRADAKSTAGQTQLANTCPSCGAPLSLQNGKCAYCGAYVRSSSSEWVVDSIEQA